MRPSAPTLLGLALFSVVWVGCGSDPDGGGGGSPGPDGGADAGADTGAGTADAEPDATTDGTAPPWSSAVSSYEYGGQNIGCIEHLNGEIALVAQDLWWYEPGGALHVYDLASRSWSEIAFSEARSVMTCATAGSDLYVTGGAFDDSGSDEMESIYRYNSGTSQVVDLGAVTSEPRRYSTVAVCDGDLLVAGGIPNGTGSAGSTVLDVYALDGQTTDTLTLPQARSHMGVGVSDSVAIFAGGLVESQGLFNESTTTSAILYDCAAGTLSTSAMPGYWGVMQDEGISTADGMVYFAGGTYADESYGGGALAGGATSWVGLRIAEYDVRADSWTTLTPPTVGQLNQFGVEMGFFGLDATDRYVMIAGPQGSDNTLHAIDVLDRETGTWDTIELERVFVDISGSSLVLGLFIDGSEVVVVKAPSAQPVSGILAFDGRTVYLETITIP